MKKHLKSLVIILILTILTGCLERTDDDPKEAETGKNQDREGNTKMKRLINDEGNIVPNPSMEYEDKVMPVGMWVSPPFDEITDERYKEIKESGINFVIGFSEGYNGAEGIEKALDAASKNDLKFLVRDSNVKIIHDNNMNQLKEAFEAYKDHPAYMGHVIVDEPGASEFESLGKLSELYKEIVPAGLYYVNMLPTYSTIEQRGIEEYDKFIQTFIDEVKPEVLSYDHYPLLTITEHSIEEYTWDYFYNLDIIREIASRNRIPFYLFIQTMWYGNTRRDPNEDEIRWQVNMSLTFGAKGIQYFTYWTPKADGITTFGDAMIDLNGNKTQHYYEVQNVNAEIRWVDDILLSCECIGVIPHMKQKPNMKTPLLKFEPLLSVEGNDTMIGCFIDNQNNKKLLVTNVSYNEDANVKLNFDVTTIEKISIIKKGETKTYSVMNTNGELILHLDKSEAVLIEMY